MVLKRFLYFLSIIVFTIPVALACSCSKRQLQQEIATTENIFLVNVNRIEVIAKGNEDTMNLGMRHGYFEVLETLKGDAKSIPYLTSADVPVCCICSAKLQNNTKYLVFTNEKGPTAYSACTNTQAVFDSDLQYFEATKVLVNGAKNKKVYQGYYLMPTKEFIDLDGKRIAVQELVVDADPRLGQKIQFEAVVLSDGSLLAINLLNVAPMTKQQTETVFFKNGS